MAIRKVLLPLISSGAGEAALSTAWTVAQLWNAHLVALHVQMDLAPAPAMSAMFRRFTMEHKVSMAEATAGAESATASFLTLTGRRLDILPQQARLADLTVVRHPATPEEVSSSAVLHAVLFDSGRPLLIAPQVMPTTVGRRIWGHYTTCPKSYANGSCISQLPFGTILKEGFERKKLRICRP